MHRVIEEVVLARLASRIAQPRPIDPLARFQGFPSIQTRPDRTRAERDHRTFPGASTSTSSRRQIRSMPETGTIPSPRRPSCGICEHCCQRLQGTPLILAH